MDKEVTGGGEKYILGNAMCSDEQGIHELRAGLAGLKAPGVMDVRVLLQEQCAFAVRGTNAKCSFQTGEIPLTVRVDPQQFRQVVQNLVLNAVQAMPGGSVITVRASRETLGYKQIPPLPAGPYVKITIADSGTGISANTVKNIFDPAFSTKEKERGLDLAICHSLVSRHGGHIAVQSTSSAGTTFAIFLPAASERELPPIEGPVAQPEPPAAKGSGRILIMDDEPSVAKVLSSLLCKLGFQSESVADGAQAINAYTRAREAGTPFDLVIMDMTIPGGMGGKETVEKLLALHPEARAIVSTGYTASSDYETYGFRGVLLKPYRLHDLSAVLNKVIGTAPDST